ncbi:hypothetical protein KFV02_03225 [Desulfohalobiaceae bacterium Ax17]|uniref:hypothetical protein n=1 Tax=Desulfovulcanus ferrireducens TaxID=2831190 RepID=UPI00207BC5E5|nr:hypothetical protein [Desulfovulcanus ferrireducens]MBT8762936.1 hypothetical protein [Desulfovulcanus ferrireducens]
MDINIIPPSKPLPVNRAYIVTMTIKSFKGRRDVEVHLFRPYWDVEEENGYPWDKLLGEPIEEGITPDINRSKKILLEAFTRDERDQLVDYLARRYASRLKTITSAPLNFPIPLGLMPLSEMPEDENFGRIRLEQICDYPLPFPVHGFYDLSSAKPIIQEEFE